jgi:hypothetical protein
MGNGCACVDPSMMIDKIKIKRIKDNNNKFLEIDLTFCKENSIGPYFLNESKDNFKNTLLILKKISYEGIRKVSKVNYLELDYLDIYSHGTLMKLKDYVNQLDRTKTGCINALNSTAFRPCFYYIMLQRHEVNIDNKKLILKENEIADDKILSQIECDIPRTFPLLKVLQEKTYTDNLTDILVTISVLDKDLSYVQGLNFIVAFILLVIGNDKPRTLEVFFSIINLRSKAFDTIYKGKRFLIKRF